MTFGTAALRPSEPLDRLQPIDSGALVDRESNLVGHLPCPKKSMEPDPMSLATDHNNLGLPELLQRALKRRLYPNSNLHRKQLCHVLQISGNTLDNWLSGNNEPRGSHIMALIRFFDPAFAQEISGGHITKLTDKRTLDAVKEMVRAHQALNAALNGIG